MSEPTTAKPSITDKVVEYIPFASDDPIKLSAQIVKDFLVTPTKAGHLPTQRDCVNFIALCKSGKLNPFTREAFLVGYDTQQGPKWQLITAEIAFLRRAEHHPQYDGVKHGIIVLNTNEQIVERHGDFMHPQDQLLGGWAIVSRKDRKEVEESRVNLPTYSTNMSRWAADPAGMIAKVARCQALRRAFPNFLGGLYTREELQLAVPTDETSIAIDNGNHVEETKQLPEPKRLPKEPVQELEQIVVAAQCRWEHFLEFLMVSGNYSEAKEAKSFDEIPVELATRLLLGAKQLLQELNRIKNKPIDESTDKFKAMHEHVEKVTKKEVAT